MSRQLAAGSWLRILAGIAVLILAVETLGAWRWGRAAAVLMRNPDRGAVMLSDDRSVALPSFVERSRRLVVRDFGSADREVVVAALTRLGHRQTAWIPAHPSGFTHLSHAALLGDQPAVALDLLGKSLKRDPLSPALRRLRAMVLLYLGVLDEALLDLAIAEAVAPGLQSPEIELPPEDQRAVRLESLRLRSELYPRKRTETALTLARLLRSQGDVAAAELVLADFGGRPEIELERARWAMEEGDLGRAIPILESIAERSSYPRAIRASAWSSIAVARDRDGDRDGALAAAQAALQLMPASPAPYVTLAGLAQRRGDADLALQHLRRAWGMAPTDVGLLHRIAAVAEGSGKTSDAILALERAVEIEPNEARHAAALVSFQIRNRDFVEAAGALSQALDRFPTDPELLRLAERLQRDIGIR